MPSPTRIRRLTSDDFDAYQSALLRSVADQPECFRITEEDITGSPSPFDDETEDDFTLGAFREDDALIGAVSLRRERQVKLRHKALLFRMFVAQEAAGRGVGRALIREAIRQARLRPGLERINLTVIASNERAKALYTSEGFVRFSMEKQAVRSGKIDLDEEMMALELHPS
ncbi:N-acetyltransferase [Capsulimonas corticalis]|uniref:N-acetyltransferase n=1 Tax=Capsulimonas corticalis TaxID=2219043 RepID=A0A402CQY1_9BACT|nr:GNAT family N-acetyltransferase [Capsulimonas corticalis]BDI34419.1 N-acetyltransferase [Capsulimonas corticalis]